jgi:aminopeptidase N
MARRQMRRPGPLAAVLAAAALICVSGQAAGLAPGPDVAGWERAKLILGGHEGDAAVTSADYDVRRYRLDLRIDPSDSTIAGRVRVVFAASVPQLREVVLDLASSLQVESVLMAGALQPFSHAGDSLVVNLPGSLAAGELDSLTVDYGGHPEAQNENYGLTFKTHDAGSPEYAGPIIASLSEPAFAKYWWPCKDRPDDKALVEMRVTVPEELIAVSNGTRQLTAESSQGGWHTYVWRESHPIASYLVSLAISDYVILTDYCTGISGPISRQDYVFPSKVDEAQVDLGDVCEMIGFLEEIAGPYPFADEKYGHATFMWTGAMEHQTVTSFPMGWLNGQGTYESIVLHELSHQWFGDSLTPAAWADIWLNEGLATYCESLWREHRSGMAGYLSYMSAARHPLDWAGQGPVYDPMPIFPGRVIYDKGAWILHMLRGRMGDEAFFAFLHDYATGSTRAYGNVDTWEDFVPLAESHAGEDLQSFFRPWLTTDAVPLLSWAVQIADGPRGSSTRLRLSLAQTQSVLFDNVYPVRVFTDAGDTTLRVHLAGRQIQEEFDLPGAIDGSDSIIIDPEGWVLWHPAGTTVAGLNLTAIFPNPATGDRLSFSYRAARTGPATLRIYDVRGRLVAERKVDLPTMAGEASLWDGRDGNGRTAPAGIYWAALETSGGARSVRKFTLLR